MATQVKPKLLGVNMFEATPSNNEYHAEKHRSVRASDINMEILQAILHGELTC